jgi:hypothetical protein
MMLGSGFAGPSTCHCAGHDENEPFSSCQSGMSLGWAQAIGHCSLSPLFAEFPTSPRKERGEVTGLAQRRSGQKPSCFRGEPESAGRFFGHPESLTQNAINIFKRFLTT